MAEGEAEALAAFRASNYEHIYLRPSSVAQGEAVVRVLQALVEHFGDRPHLIPSAGPDVSGLSGGEPGAVHAAVAYVAGMTDRFAFSQAVALLDWDLELHQQLLAPGIARVNGAGDAASMHVRPVVGVGADLLVGAFLDQLTGAD